MLKALVIGDGKNISETDDRDKIADVFLHEKKLLWLDLLEPTQEELDYLGNVFTFHPLCLKDCSIYTKNPKIDEFDHYLFLVTHVLTDSNGLDFPELDIFLSHRFLVTVHYIDIIELNRYWERLRQQLYDGPISLDFILYNVFDAVADSYNKKIEEIATGIEDLEDRIISDDQQDILPEISSIRRSLIYLRRQLTSEIDMLEKLIRPDIEFFSNRSRAYLRDSMERFDRVLHFAEVNRELMAALVDTYLSVLSNRMNRIFASQNTVMQRLTVITAIFMPLSLLAGIYGMNFIHMPELNWSFGYFLVLVVMLTTGIGLYVYFKRIGWLD